MICEPSEDAVARVAEILRLRDLSDSEIDLSDTPEQTDFKGAIVGRFFLP